MSVPVLRVLMVNSVRIYDLHPVQEMTALSTVSTIFVIRSTLNFSYLNKKTW